jgi:hypothetical protein
MLWLEDNRLMVIGDYHHAFVAAFARADVTAADLHGLRKRKRWKVGAELARARMLGRHTKYSDAEVAWLRENATMVITDYHRAFCARFDRTDVTACALSGFRKKQKWQTGRDGRFNKGALPWSKGKKIGNNPGSARTQFKKGTRTGVAAQVYQPIGCERIHTSGYRQRKIHDGLPMQSRWKFVHRIEWEKLNGPIPEGMALKCKGDHATPTRLTGSSSRAACCLGSMANPGADMTSHPTSSSRRSWRWRSSSRRFSKRSAAGGRPREASSREASSWRRAAHRSRAPHGHGSRCLRKGASRPARPRLPAGGPDHR